MHDIYAHLAVFTFEPMSLRTYVLEIGLSMTSGKYSCNEDVVF